MIDSFRGKFGWLSNFWGCKIEFEGLTYHSTENAYQAAKTLDPAIRKIFVKLSCDEAKRLGGQIKVRQDWMDINMKLMKDLNKQKFQNTELRNKLINTYPEEIVEGNDWGDTFWGKVNGVGYNHLGRILMEIREELMKTPPIKGGCIYCGGPEIVVCGCCPPGAM